MKRVVYLIFSYCCLMAAAMACMLVFDVSTVRQHQAQLSQAQANLETITLRADNVQAEFDDLARQQRQQRAQLSGEQAILVSQAVQELSDALTKLRQQENQAKAVVTSSTDQLEQIQLVFIPHVAFLLLHALAIWLFWPWRVFAITTRKPKREWTPK